MKAFIIDRMVDESEAVIGVQDLALQRGFAIFDFLRSANGKFIFPEEHLDRFFRSAEWLHLKGIPSRTRVKELMIELNSLNGIQHAGMRMMLTGGYAEDGYQPTTSNLILLQKPLKPAQLQLYKQGIKLISHAYQRTLPEIKSINYLMGVWLLRKMEAEAADDVVFHYNNMVSELPRSNIFMVTQDDEILTPASHILPGITRSKIMELTGFDFIEKDFSLEALKKAKEVFVTSTTKKILPVRQIDESIIGDAVPGRITSALTESFARMLENQYGVQE